MPIYERDGLIMWARIADEGCEYSQINNRAMAVERDLAGDCRYFDLVHVRAPEDDIHGAEVLQRTHTREIACYRIDRDDWLVRVNALVAWTIAHRIEDGLPDILAEARADE